MPDKLIASQIDNIKQQAKDFFDESRGSHDWDHTLRVHRLSHRIGAAEGADLTVLSVAAYLHDIGRARQDRASGGVCHAEVGAQMAQPIVAGLALTDDQKENILHCIRSHRYRGHPVPQSLEAKVLFDADKLDAIGAVGVARAFLFAGEVGARLHNRADDISDAQPYSQEDTGYREYTLKLSKIRMRMLTETGCELARDRHRVMADFFDRFLIEIHGRG
jgi:uncharacterized protein